MILSTKNNQGLTLIEVLAVTAIFVIGLAAMLTSAVGIFKSAVFSGDYLVATNLAREAAEIVRNKRDNNFLMDQNWQEGFDAFSYSRSQIDTVIKYILRQEEHHKKRTFQEEYIQLLKKFEVEYDEQYLFKWIAVD